MVIYQLTTIHNPKWMEINKMKRIIGVLVAMLFCIGIATAETSVDVNMDVDIGEVEISADNTEAGSHFYGIGGFSGNFNSVETLVNYLDTNVLVESTTGANLFFNGFQELSGYTNNKVTFESFAGGDTALMNNRFDNSHYVVQLARVDTSKDFLSASGSNYGIGWRNAISDDADESSYAQVELYGDGTGVFDTNQWHPTSIGRYGWGSPDSISAPDIQGYYTPTNTVSATGNGQFVQSGFGENSLEMNGFIFGSGTGTFTAIFNGGFSGAYTIRAK